MAIHYKMVSKQNNLATPPETKYYPCAVSKGKVTLEELSAIAASRSTLSKADCFAVLVALSEGIAESLAQGKIVELNHLGTFAVTLKGAPANNVEDLGKSSIKGTRVVYKPSSQIKNKLKNVSYKRIR